MTPSAPAPILPRMFSAFTRILLALSMAFVFTGQMEAAAAHCAKIAQEAAVKPLAPSESGGELDCHGMGDATPTHQSAPQPSPDIPAPEHCECIAALKVCAAAAAMPGSTRIAPYDWASPQAAIFVSIESSPGLRPPRA